MSVISLINLKGGVGKTVSSINIASSFAKCGKKVLIIDTDSQGNIAKSLGMNPNDMDNTMVDLISEAIDDEVTQKRVKECIRQAGNLDIIPSNLLLSKLEYKLMNAVSRETILKDIVSQLEDMYEYIIIDCPPSLGLMVKNALTASDYVLIPVEAHYLSFDSLMDMLDTVDTVKKKLNPNLQIAGIFLTMYQSRTLMGQGVKDKVHEIYGNTIKVFDDCIPFSIKASEQTLAGKSLIDIAPQHPISLAYMNIAKELMANEK